MTCDTGSVASDLFSRFSHVSRILNEPDQPDQRDKPDKPNNQMNQINQINQITRSTRIMTYEDVTLMRSIRMPLCTNVPSVLLSCVSRRLLYLSRFSRRAWLRRCVL
jgi:hypothetical protein